MLKTSSIKTRVYGDDLEYFKKKQDAYNESTFKKKGEIDEFATPAITDYVKDLSVNNRVIIATMGDGSTKNIELPDDEDTVVNDYVKDLILYGRTLVVFKGDNTTESIELPAEEETIGSDYVRGMAIEGNSLVVAMGDGTVRSYNLPSGNSSSTPTMFVSNMILDEENNLVVIMSDSTAKTIPIPQSGGDVSYKQVQKNDIATMTTFDIVLENSNTEYRYPPIEVLKYRGGESDVSSEAYPLLLDDCIADEIYVAFGDNGVWLNTSFTYAFTEPIALGEAFYSESDDLNISSYKSVSSVEVN